MTDLSTDLICFGNPLLDMVLKAENNDALISRYGLLPDNQIEANEEQKPLFDEVYKNDSVIFTPGGSAQNTARFYRWILGGQGRVSFVGCVGRDKFGQTLQNLVTKDGVDTRYIYHDTAPTGRSANLISAANRSLVADIGAANFCPPETALTPHNLALLTSAAYVYVEGFFVTHDAETALEVARCCSQWRRRLVFSLSGTYVCQQHADAICRLLPHCSFLFGHISEYRALTRALGLQEGEFEVSSMGFSRLVEAAESRRLTVETMMSANGETKPAPSPEDTGMPHLKMLVTQSGDPVALLDATSVVTVPVPAVSPAQIADTTGAGDAVVAGFLAARQLGKDLEESIRFGVLAAREVIQLLGCSVPHRPHPLMVTTQQGKHRPSSLNGDAMPN